MKHTHLLQWVYTHLQAFLEGFGFHHTGAFLCVCLR